LKQLKVLLQKKKLTKNRTKLEIGQKIKTESQRYFRFRTITL